MIAFAIFFAIFIGCSVWGNIIPSQIFKDSFFNFSCAILYIAFMVLRKARINRKTVFAIVAYVSYATYFLIYHRNDWGWHYCTLLISKFVMYGILVLLIVSTDIIKSFREKPLKINFLTVLSGLAFLATLVIGQMYLVPVILPLLIFSAVRPTKEELNKGMLAFSFAAYVAFAIMMTLSFIIAPDVYDGNRYLGFFTFPVAGGLLASIAFLSGITLISHFSEKIKTKKGKVFFCIAIMLYPCVGLLTFLNRASILGLVCVGLMVFIFGYNKHDSKKALKRGLLIAAVSIIGVVILSIALHFLIKGGTPVLDEYTASHGENSPGMYFVSVVRSTLNSTSKTGVFLDGTVKNAYDRLSSGRLGIWYMGIRQIRRFGNSDTAVTVPNGDFFAHTHNTYLDIFLRFGWIGGCIIVLWLFVCFALICKRILNGDKNLRLPFMWMSFCLGLFLVERALPTEWPVFLLLMLLYPLYNENVE